MAGWRGRALALVLACLAVTVQAPAVADGTPVPPVRILLVGDSVTQGSAGDYTWRYRLWKALTDAQVDVELVGPRDDLYDSVTGQPGSTAYATDVDPEFDRDHAARWGMALSVPDVPLADLVAEYEPDVVVEMRGINDLTWYGETSAEVASLVAAEIEDARAVDPDLEFVVGQLPQVWLGSDDSGRTSVARYDEERLPALAAALDTPESRVVVAQSGSGFVELTDTWDPAHLAASGEVRLAAAVTDELATLGIGTPYPRPLPVVDNGHWAAATGLGATPEEQAVHLSWIRPPGAAAQYVWVRDVTAEEAWRRLPFPVSGASWTVGLLAGGHAYDFRLQSAKGSAVSERFSAVVRATARMRPPDPPGAVTGLRLTPGPQQLSVGWTAAPGATSYDVAWSAPDVPSGVLSVTDPWAVLTGLRAGVAYAVTVTPRNGGGTGPAGWATGVPAPPPLQPPALPAGLHLVPGPHQLRVTWDSGAPGTTYDVGLVGATTGFRGHRTVVGEDVRFAGLLAGERYTALVTPLNEAGAGPLAQVTGVPTGPRVAGPDELVARALRDGRVRLSWRPSRRATSYDVALRRGGWATVRSTSANRVTLRLGTGSLRLRVRAWHQRLPGGWSKAVRLRVG